jgi:hypothetical protein
MPEAFVAAERAFESLEGQVFEALTQAQEERNLDRIRQLVSSAETCREGILQVKRLVSLRQTILDTLGEARSASSTRITAVSSAPVEQSVPGQLRPFSRKARGNSRRAEFLKRLGEKGIFLQRIKNVVYETPAGGRIGIATATELSHLPDRWFLGLPDMSYVFAVLLIEDLSGQRYDIILPASFVSGAWAKLSRSAGYVKFHLERSGPNFMLRVVGGDPQSLNAFIDNYESLR